MFTFLALGDSYTIGELQPLHESFSYQAVQLFRAKNLDFSAPEIIAKTGWTTDDLLNHIKSIKLSKQYDLVTLLIGVNNQYQGRIVENFIPELNSLIEIAIEKAGNKKFEIVEFEGLNHFFQTAKTGSSLEYPEIAETISPKVLDKVSSWIIALK